MTADLDADICGQCSHDFGPHIFVPIFPVGPWVPGLQRAEPGAYTDPMKGGLIFCQHLDSCDCVSTWGPSSGGADMNPYARILPPPEVVAQWKALLIEAKKEEEEP